MAVLLAAFVLGPGAVVAQGRTAAPPVDSALVRVRLRDGADVVGRVVSSDSLIVLVTPSGARLEFPRTALASWAPFRGTARGATVAYDDPNTSRLFFAPTGRTLDRGEGYFADYYLFFPFVGYGLHDRVTLSGGMSIIPGGDRQVVYAGPKIGVVRSERLNVALGGSYSAVPGEGDEAWTGYGAVTVGGPDRALTAIGGYVEFSGDHGVGAILGGETRISQRSKLLLEVWKLEGVNEVPTVFGVRFFGEKLAVDFGLLYVFGVETDGWPFFPWVDFVVNW